MQAVGAANLNMHAGVPFKTAAHTICPGGPQAQWARGQEQLFHCNLTPVPKGAPRLKGVEGLVPKQPLVRSQAPTKAKPPALVARVIHSTCKTLIAADICRRLR